MPRLVTCPHCGRVHSSAYHCSDKPRREYVRREAEKGRYTSAWHQKANPVAVNNKDVFNAIRDMRAMAVLYENKRENFLCKHCNIKYKGLGVEGYVDINKVKACRIEDNPNWWRGRRVYLGMDLSQTDDNTAVAMVTEEDGVIYAKVWGFVPADKVAYKSKKEGVDYKRLIAQGVCFACGDEVIGYDFVEQFILELQDKLGVVIVQVGYDRYNAISTVQKLEAAGIECVEVRQHSSVLHSPTKLLQEKILSRKFAYNENRMLEINFENARCTEDTNRNKYVNKKRSAGKVDMVVAIINGVYLQEQEDLYGMDFVIQT